MANKDLFRTLDATGFREAVCDILGWSHSISDATLLEKICYVVDEYNQDLQVKGRLRVTLGLPYGTKGADILQATQDLKDQQADPAVRAKAKAADDLAKHLFPYPVRPEQLCEGILSYFDEIVGQRNARIVELRDQLDAARREIDHQKHERQVDRLNLSTLGSQVGALQKEAIMLRVTVRALELKARGLLGVARNLIGMVPD